ncbi:WD40-repeat-containing domain protein [Chlamydoabsidia padenii]|nr:WD40-repeat-containing domain protein [Chlamydoabsidia padenii]
MAKPRVHFGSLEEQESVKRFKHDDSQQTAIISAASSAGGGIDLDALAELADRDSSTGGLQGNQQVLAEFDRRKRAREIAVPTDDGRVRQRLREIGEPQCLFGEDAGDRRDRLRFLLSKLTGEEAASESESDDEEEEEEFFTPGSQALLEARQWITTYSLPRAKRRLEKQQLETQIPLTQLKVGRRELSQKLKEYTGWSSQVADERPVSQCAFSPDSKLLLTGSWSGGCKLWSVPDCKLVTTLAGHTDRVGGVAFHPESTLSLDKSVANFATSGAEGSVKLWSLDSASPLATMEGHVGRVARIGYHPSGRYIGSAGFDGTWRLWDIERTEELLLQEGHAKEVYALSFQCDGSLVATGGLDAIGRLWDLRTGRSAMALQGHIKDIIGLDWSPNGYHLASASADNSVKIWDIRALRNIYTISAHQSLVSDVKFAKGRSPMASNNENDTHEASSIYGTYLTTVGYDGCVKMWSADDYRLMKSLEGHDGKVMGVDISKDGRFIASTGFDRTFKLWADENLVI